MSVREEIGLVALHELKKNLRSVKGIVMFVLFFLGGAVPTLIIILLEHLEKAAHLDKMSPEQRHEMTERSLMLRYGGDHDIASYLSSCPGALLFLLWGTQAVLPLLCLVIGFDQIAGEVQHRGIRYLVGRAHRSAIVAGKAIGIWGVVSIMTLVLHAVVWVMMIARGEHGVGETLSWGLRIWAFSVASAGASVGLANLVSSWFKVPVIALFIGLGIAFGLFLARLIVLAIGEGADFAKWVFPASYEVFMVKPDALSALGGCAASIGWGAAMVALACFVVQKKDV